MRALSLVNVKGGVGKTTTAVNLAASFAGAGLRTLLVDLDPQGSATVSVGFEPTAVGPDAATAAEVLLGRAPLEECVQETDVEGLGVLCSSTDLALAERSLARKHEPAKLLREALESMDRAWDLVVIDCPPGLGILVEVALGASAGYLAPVTPQPLAVDALDRLFAGIDSLSLRFEAPELFGILLTMVDHRTRVTDEAVADVRRRFGAKVLATEIPINIQLAVAPERGRTIFGHEGWSTGAAAYRKLGGEVLRRARRKGWI